MRSCAVAGLTSSLRRKMLINCSQSISSQSPVTPSFCFLTVISLSIEIRCKGEWPGRMSFVCLLFRIEMKEELDKWISEIATTLSRAPVSSNSVVKSNTPARKHPFSFVGMFTSASNFLQKQVKVEGAGRLRSWGEKIKMSGNSI